MQPSTSEMSPLLADTFSYEFHLYFINIELLEPYQQCPIHRDLSQKQHVRIGTSTRRHLQGSNLTIINLNIKLSSNFM